MIVHFGPNDPTYVYRLYDANDDLLYVGVAFEPEKRWKEHRAIERWWSQVARKETVLYPTRREAFDAELKAIKTENPKHNIQGVERPHDPTPSPLPKVDHSGEDTWIRHHETGQVITIIRAGDAERAMKRAHTAVRRFYPGLPRITFEEEIRDSLRKGA